MILLHEQLQQAILGAPATTSLQRTLIQVHNLLHSTIFSDKICHFGRPVTAHVPAERLPHRKPGTAKRARMDPRLGRVSRAQAQTVGSGPSAVVARAVATEGLERREAAAAGLALEDTVGGGGCSARSLCLIARLSDHMRPQ